MRLHGYYRHDYIWREPFFDDLGDVSISNMNAIKRYDSPGKPLVEYDENVKDAVELHKLVLDWYGKAQTMAELDADELKEIVLKWFDE